MKLFDAIGVGALNWDMLFKISPEKFNSLNRDLEGKGINPLIYRGEDSGKPEECEPTIETTKKYQN